MRDCAPGMTARTLSRPLPLRAGWNTFYDLDRVHVVDPFVTQPEPGAAVYWRLHGIGGARHSYTDGFGLLAGLPPSLALGSYAHNLGTLPNGYNGC